MRISQSLEKQTFSLYSRLHPIPYSYFFSSTEIKKKAISRIVVERYYAGEYSVDTEFVFDDGKKK